MAANEREGVYEFTKFTGLRNVVDPERMEAEDLDVGVNVDIDDSGEVKRRKGYSSPVVSGDYSDVWSNGFVCLGVKDGTDLVYINPDWTTKTLRTTLSAGLEMSYTTLGRNAAYSNGKETGIVEGAVDRSWGIVPPTSQPNSTAVSGSLLAGRYQYAVTFVRTDGQESGTPEAGLVTVTNGGFSLTDIPVSDDPDVNYTRVYVSRADGEGLYARAWLDTGTTTADFFDTFTMLVNPLETQFLSHAPAGNIISEFAGRALVAQGSVLYYSEPFAYELFDLRKNFQFLNPITLIAPMRTGVYLGTSAQVFWLAGKEPSQWDLNTSFSYGAVPGADYSVSTDMLFDGKGSGPALVFHSTQGICVAREGGSITNITQGQYTIPAQERGAGIVRVHRGMVQYVSTMQGVGGATDGTAVGAGDIPVPKITA